MQDTVIKGTRNSRSIIGSPSIPEAWEQARAQLIQSGWPIDLGNLNAAGLKTKGTDLNKENLLKDATAALYGLLATAVPDQVLAKARTLITAAQTAANERALVVTGSYIGNYTNKDSVVTLTFSAPPKLVAIGGIGINSNDYRDNGPLILVKGAGSAATAEYTYGLQETSYVVTNVTWSGNSVSFGSQSGRVMNLQSRSYVYAAIL